MLYASGELLPFLDRQAVEVGIRPMYCHVRRRPVGATPWLGLRFQPDRLNAGTGGEPIPTFDKRSLYRSQGGAGCVSMQLWRGGGTPRRSPAGPYCASTSGHQTPAEPESGRRESRGTGSGKAGLVLPDAAGGVHRPALSAGSWSGSGIWPLLDEKGASRVTVERDLSLR